MRHLFVFMVSCLFVASGHASEGSTGDESKLSDVVQLRVWSVHATKAGDAMAGELQKMAKHLEALNYGSFVLLRKDGASIPLKATRKIDIAGNRTVRVTVLDRNPDRARVRVQIGDGGQIVLDTTVAIRRNGFFIVAGPKHDGGILVLPIFARY